MSKIYQEQRSLSSCELAHALRQQLLVLRLSNFRQI